MLDYVFDPHSALAVKVFGDDFNELRRIGKDDRRRPQDRTRRRATPRSINYAPLPQIAIKVDRAAAARYGINVADMADLIRPESAAAPVSQVFIGDRHYDITVRFPPDDRNSPEAIKNLVLTSSDGALIPLSQVADVKLQSGESTINRDMNHRYLLVKLDYHDRDPLSVVADVKKAIAQRVSFDRSKYHIEWGGQLEGQQRAEARFRLIIGMVLAAMMVLLYAEFGALRQVLLIVGVVPLATLGGLIALHATGMTLNVASGVGFIALFGVAVMNGVIMVANLNRMREQGLSLFEAVSGGRRRAAAAGADDGLGGNRRHAAGGARDWCRQRRAAQSCDGRRRRTYSSDAAHSVHPPNFLFRAGARSGAACSTRGAECDCSRGGLSVCKINTSFKGKALGLGQWVRG